MRKKEVLKGNINDVQSVRAAEGKQGALCLCESGKFSHVDTETVTEQCIE